MLYWIYFCCWVLPVYWDLEISFGDVCWSHDMYVFGVVYLYLLRPLRNFINARCLETFWRRNVYFLNICVIHVFYRFNRSKALQMGYTVEPFNVPIWMLPPLVLWDRLTPILLAKDMDNKLQEGCSHLRTRSSKWRTIFCLSAMIHPEYQHTSWKGVTVFDKAVLQSYLVYN